eukprot:3570635-Prymnesium_polylepis.1
MGEGRARRGPRYGRHTCMLRVCSESGMLGVRSGSSEGLCSCLGSGEGEGDLGSSEGCGWRALIVLSE